jgi:short-subunit dehydrogenase
MSSAPHAVITGASSGIGEALARRYAKEGFALTLVARRRGLLEELAGSLGAKVRIVQADLSVLEGAGSWLGEAEAQLGPVHTLVNNAGVQIVDPALAVDVERAESLLRVDYMVPMRLIHRVAPQMVARGAGTIINVASVAAIVPTPGMLHYNAAKAAMASASETLRAELEGTGVHVLTVYPGPVTTAMETAARDRYGDSKWVEYIPTGSTEELAKLIVEHAEERRPRLIYPPSYGVARHFPQVATWITQKVTPRLSQPPSGH